MTKICYKIVGIHFLKCFRVLLTKIRALGDQDFLLHQVSVFVFICQG